MVQINNIGGGGWDDDVEMAARPVLVGVAQENGIVAEGGAAVGPAQFWSRPVHQAGKRGQMLTVVGELVDESVGGGAAAALALGIGGDVGQIALRRGASDEAGRSDSLRRLVQAVEVIADEAPHVVAGVAAALGLRGLEHVAQLGALRTVDRVAHGVFGRGKPAGGQLGLHPLFGVRR